jgi:DNA-binding transcriptional MerR regulator
MTHTTLWTLDQLSAAVSRALTVDYAGSVNGRVRDVPDRRTIRYYTTLGLIDRPAAMRGRTAMYGRRHLLQLVAIKRLQAEGSSLAEVQARLVGLTDRALEALARLPAELDAPPAPRGAPEPPPRRAERFWTAAPAPAARPLLAVPLDHGVTLLLPAARALTDTDLSALRDAAAPLVNLLTERRLLAADGNSTFSQGDAS